MVKNIGDVFDIHYNELYNLTFDTIYKINIDHIDNEIIDLDRIKKSAKNNLDKDIYQCRRELSWYPNSKSYFELEEGKIYYLLSGFNHFYFKIITKSRSQYNGIPYYTCKLRNNNTYNNDMIFKDEIKDFSNGMIFVRYELCV